MGGLRFNSIQVWLTSQNRISKSIGRLSYKCVFVLKQDRVSESNIEAS